MVFHVLYFICSLFNEAVISSASNVRQLVNKELERMCKEVFVAYFHTLFHNFARGTERI